MKEYATLTTSDIGLSFADVCYSSPKQRQNSPNLNELLKDGWIVISTAVTQYVASDRDVDYHFVLERTALANVPAEHHHV